MISPTVQPQQPARMSEMNHPPGLFTRLRRRALELLAPRLQYAWKRRFWNRAWAGGAFPSPRNFWFLPAGVVPRQLTDAIESGWFAPGAKALDIGCGHGAIAAHLADRGFDVTGVDFAAPAIERARVAFRHLPNLRFEVADICELTSGLGLFDVLFDRGCYHGLPKSFRGHYTRTVAALSKPGAHFLLMYKLSIDVDVAAPTRALLAVEALMTLSECFAPYFTVERSETISFNNRGDDDEAQSLPGLVIWWVRSTVP